MKSIREFANRFATPAGRLTRLVVWSSVLMVSGCASRFDVQGHRGARGLAPENTLAAFAKALSLGVTTLELDVGVSSDDQLVIAHDPALNPNLTRTRQGEYLSQSGPSLRSLSYAQIGAYNVGQIKAGTTYAGQFPAQQAEALATIPRLVDLFELVNQSGDRKVRFNIETKIRPDRASETADPETFVRLLLDAIRLHRLEHRVSIQSFDWRTLALVQAQAPRVPTVYLTAQQPNFNNLTATPSWTGEHRFLSSEHLPVLVKQAGGSVWSPYFRDLNAQQLALAKQLGLKVIPWTINEVKEMRHYIDLGVDGIITDRPDLLLNLLRE
jgi:glycerophosphoryl diester phosphodiesterase